MTEDTEANLTRRLARLKVQPIMATKTDDYLTYLLKDAVDCFHEITHSEDPGEKVDGLMCRMVTGWADMEGAEGTTSASEGGLARTWEALPADVYKRLKTYRRVVGINATYVP